MQSALLRLMVAAVALAGYAISFTGVAHAGPPPIDIVIVHTDKGKFVFKTEVAATPQHRTRGLMFRQRLPKDHGMLFYYGEPRPVAMWMKNTRISLDMVFISADGRVTNIVKTTKPMSLDTIPSKGPVVGVLEVVAGTADRIGLKPGDKIVHPLFSK